MKPGAWVLARTPRGLEPAMVLSMPRTVPLAPGTDEEEARESGEVVRTLPAEGIQPPWLECGRFSAEFQTAWQMIRELGLPMKLSDVEVFPKRDKAVFYFLADGRVDFRQLVRNLARALHLRVEMKQIGVRDEARLKGTCGHCGLELCCAGWIRRMAPVNMKMAKAQKTTLDPDKISGRCGRLLCCLRYEEQVYVEHRRRLPPRGSQVETAEGKGVVAGHDVLRCQVQVLLESGKSRLFPLDQVRITGPQPAPGEPEELLAPLPPEEIPEPPDLAPVLDGVDPEAPAPGGEPPPGEGQGEDPGRGRHRRRRRRLPGRPSGPSPADPGVDG